MLNECSEQKDAINNFVKLEPKVERDDPLPDFNSELILQTGISKFTQFNVNKVCPFYCRSVYSH